MRMKTKTGEKDEFYNEVPELIFLNISKMKYEKTEIYAVEAFKQP